MNLKFAMNGMVNKVKKKARNKTLGDINLLARAIVKAATEENDKRDPPQEESISYPVIKPSVVS